MKEDKNIKGHSEEYFDGSRDYWWNLDFMELMAKRWNLGLYSSLLDIGCGVCHWSKLLIPFLKNNAEVCAIDRDEKWAKGTNEIKNYFARYNATIDFKCENAEELQIENDSFDVVTCQTVLIHLKNPQAAIQEMYRVVKPGGIVICVEPNNLCSSLYNDSLSRYRTIDEILDDVKYGFLYEKGKELLGQGNNSIGDHIAEMQAKIGLKDIRVYMSDKAIPCIPPYGTDEQQSVIKSIDEWNTTDMIEFDRQNQKKCITATGDHNVIFFEKCWERNLKRSREMIAAVREHTYFGIEASVMYLTSGIK